MNQQFIELTITSDSGDALVASRKGLVRLDQITSVVDISSGDYIGPALTQVSLEEEADYLNDDDESGGVVRARRTICVIEGYETVKKLINSAAQASD